MEYFSARMRGEEDFSRARDDAGPVGLDAEARFFFERSPLHAGPIPEDAFAALLDPRVPAPVTGGLRLRKPAMGPGAGYYQMRNSSLASVLNQHEGIPITLCVAFCGIARRGGLSPMFLNVGGHARGHAPRRRRRIANGTSRGSVSRHAAVSAKPLRAPPPRDARRRNRRSRAASSRETPAQLDEHLRLRDCDPRETRRVVSWRRRSPVAGDPGLRTRTLVTHRALIDAMRGVLEGIGWMALEGEPGLRVPPVPSRQARSRRIETHFVRARAQAGPFPARMTPVAA